MWEYHPAPARQRLRFIAGLLITLAYLLLTRWIRSDLAVGIVLQVVSIAAHLVLAVLLLAFLPNRASQWRDLVPGALVTTVGLIGINVFTVVWLPHKLASLSETYGALGVAVATLSYLAMVGYLLVASILTNVMWHEYRMSREAAA
jgi:membrane protein